ncbi:MULTISPECIES: hypothetical protein [Actinosynnema]|uniref:hypothetical protein n=1 Tax=Actinosynnema TaxID=40566 RepID=UPI0020A48762|nr:hypothetical protein [Actinosynnema pretiosum]MCP2098719.1 hypothetical protein [Actinosynnema pretiosum]
MPYALAGVRVGSVVPGRQRWHVPQVRGNPRTAFVLETALPRLPGITHVRANPVTGRVLVLHRRSLGVTEIGAALRDALATAPPAARPAVRPHPVVLLGVATGISSAVVRGLAGRVALGAPLLLVAGGAAALLVAGARPRPPGRADPPAQRARPQRPPSRRPRPRRERPADVDGSRSFSTAAAGAVLRFDPPTPPAGRRLDRDPAPHAHAPVPAQARPLHRRVPRHR